LGESNDSFQHSLSIVSAAALGRGLTADPTNSPPSIRHSNRRRLSAEEHDNQPTKSEAH
jgi:hypothetical protein